MEDNPWDDLRVADQVIQIVREGGGRDVATVGDVTTDKVIVANVYDEIVFAGTVVTFDDL